MKKENFMKKFVKQKKQGIKNLKNKKYLKFRDNALAAHQVQYKNELDNYKIYYEDKINGEKNKVK